MNRNYLAIIFIVALTLFVWYKVLFQSFMLDGFIFFNYGLFSTGGLLKGAIKYDTLGLIIFEVLPLIFADKIQFYQAWMLMVLAIVNIIFYYLVLELTGKKTIALFTAIFFIPNYATAYEIFGMGLYIIFVNRIPSLVIGLVSLLLLTRFLKKSKKKSLYIMALLLYWLGIMVAQFNIFLLPLFVLFIFFFQSSFFLSLPFVLPSLILLWLDKKYGTLLIVNQSLYDYIFHNPELVNNIAYQLTWLTLPLAPLKWLIKFREPIIVLSIPVVLFYLATIFYLRRKQPTLRPLIYSLAFFILVSLFLNAYIRPSEVYRIYGSSRYLYIPSIAYSILLALLLFNLFSGKRLVKKMFLVGVLILWIFYNVNQIWINMDGQQKKHIASKAVLQYIKENSYRFADDSFIILPEVIGYHGANFCRRFYGRNSLSFAPIFAEWEKTIGKDFNLEKLVVIDYDYTRMTALDRSKEFQELLRSNKEIKQAKAKYK